MWDLLLRCLPGPIGRTELSDSNSRQRYVWICLDSNPWKRMAGLRAKSFSIWEDRKERFGEWIKRISIGRESKNWNWLEKPRLVGRFLEERRLACIVGWGKIRLHSGSKACTWTLGASNSVSVAQYHWVLLSSTEYYTIAAHNFQAIAS